MLNPDLQDEIAGKRALITGGMGFIGSNLARRLVGCGVEVSVIDSNNPETGANSYNLADIQYKVDINLGDIRDRAKMKTLIKGRDFLFNLAGLSSHLGAMHGPIEDLEVNALAQLKILELCRETNQDVRMVFAGTRQVYGIGNSLPVNELAPADPIDYNGVSKLAGELYHILSNRIYGMWTSSLRMTNTYGPRMRVRDARQTFIGLWIRLLLEDRPFSVYEPGEQIRDFNYVEDVVDALILCVINPVARGKLYNLGGEPVSLLEAADLLIDLHEGGTYTIDPFPAERLKIDIKDYAGDYSRIKTDLGWEPATSLREGLQQTLEFYRIHRQYYW
jgi:UDP-glucose 4-epimerase